VICGLEGLDDYAKVAKRRGSKTFLAVSSDNIDRDEVEDLAEKHGLELLYGAP
jgi:hypothetical protein